MESLQNWIDKGRQRHESGDYEQAFQCYREALILEPGHSEVKNLLGLLMHHVGAPDQALEWMLQAVDSEPSNADYYNHLGVVYRALKQFAAAETAYLKALELNPVHGDYWFNLGNLKKDCGDRNEALRCFERSLVLKPGASDALHNLGVTCVELGQWNRAVSCFQETLKIRSDWANPHVYLARALKNMGDRLGMVAHCHKAYELHPTDSAALIELGVLYIYTVRTAKPCSAGMESLPGQLQADVADSAPSEVAGETNLQRAECCLRDAISMDPSSGEAYNNLGVCMQIQGRHDDALACFEQAIQCQNDFGEARMNRALQLLLRGRFEEGWNEYEWRWKWDGFGSALKSSDRAWKGESLEAKTILAYAEQGLGDTIFFSRWLTLLAQKAGRVILECQPSLKRLLSGLKGVASVHALGEKLPDFDFHIPLGGLPKMLMQAESPALNEAPYVARPMEPVVAVPAASVGQYKIGLVWAGNPDFLDDANRSISAQELLPLFDIPGIAWFNLQFGAAKSAADALAPAGAWHDVTDLIQDFSGTAALIGQLDLVISVDTSTAHLAGAMGKPVWVLLPFVPDWRWQLNRNDCPWYPSMRLFRKSRREEPWSGVIQQVKSALESDISRIHNNESIAVLRRQMAGECWIKAGRCLKAGSVEEGMGALLDTARFDPERKGVRMALAALCRKVGRLDESLLHCRIECRLDPGNADAHLNLARVLLAMDRFQEAVEAALDAVDIRPDYADAWLHMGAAWRELGDLTRAIQCFERGVALDPSNPEPHWHLSTALLAQGEFERGWAEHEWRWLMPDFTTPCARYTQPSWDGGSLAGKTILLHAEQGAGDTIQFVRYASLLARAGARVIVGCSRELASLIGTADGVSRVVTSQSELSDFDCHAPLMGLPHLIRTRLNTIPKEIPYLSAQPDRLKLVGGKPGCKRVGLVWAGNSKHNHDRRRSMPARCLLPLLSLPGIQFYSLQVGAAGGDLSGLAGAEPMIDLSGQLKDYADTACALDQLDLLISVDTACAHLAGALGRPVWLLVHNPSEWRWLADRDDSPWYPTMLVLRQDKPGGWDSLILRVKAMLLEWTATASAGSGCLAQAAMASRDQGIASHGQGRLDDAICWFQKALSLNENCAEACCNLGLALHHAKRLGESARHLRKAVLLAPGDPRMHLNLGSVLVDSGCFDEALKHIDTALAIKPDFAEALNARGVCMQVKGRFEDAITCYREAVRLQPGYADALLNLATALREAGNLEESIDWHRRLVQINPDLAENRSNLGFALLLAGRFEEGWREYEWRVKTKGRAGREPSMGRPRWSGEPLAGRTILLRAEQGMGDSIQFIRYASLAAAKGASVLVECPAALKRLFQTVEGVCSVHASGDPLPDFDFFAPLPSLPMLFKTDLSCIPGKTPYLHGGAWNEEDHFKSGLHAGIAWAGNPDHKNDRHRSIPFGLLKPLFCVQGVVWHNLQVGGRAGDWRLMEASGFDDSANFADYFDTASAMAKLDLVISVDTSAAHLAGALGTRVWVMLPFAPDWRWMLRRSDSPWYPAMTLFRQPSPGDWGSVVSQITQELQRLRDALLQGPGPSQ